MCMTTFNALTDQIIAMGPALLKGGEFKKYELDQGEIFTMTVKKNDKIHVIDAFMKKGTIFPVHMHEYSDETFLLYEGVVNIYCINGQEIKNELQIGKPFIVRKGVHHFLKVKEDSWMLSSLIPPDVQVNI